MTKCVVSLNTLTVGLCLVGHGYVSFGHAGLTVNRVAHTVLQHVQRGGHALVCQCRPRRLIIIGVWLRLECRTVIREKGQTARK
jgi:hypothetical protein